LACPSLSRAVYSEIIALLAVLEILEQDIKGIFINDGFYGRAGLKPDSLVVKITAIFPASMD